MASPTAAVIQRQRRAGVSAQAVTSERLKNWRPSHYPKTDRERSHILASIEGMRLLFGHLSHADRAKVVDAMFRIDISSDTYIIKQGDEGDNFYTIQSGRVDFEVARCGGPAEKVGEAGPGATFGELALLYNAPRAASVLAVEACVLWALDRDTFQMMLTTAENTKKRTYEDFLENIEIFKGLNKYERCQLSDMLTQCIYRPGETIVRQGDQGDRFYIVEDGDASCLIEDSGNELLVSRYKRGGYFGEVALIGDGIRLASVYAVSRCKVLSIDRPTFDRVLGPLKDIFSNNLGVYRQILNEKQAAWLERIAVKSARDSNK